MVRRISEIPGVQSAAFAENGPLGSRTGSDVVGLAGHDPIRADSDSVTPGFFDTVGISRFSGRDFTAADGPDAPRVVIVNQSLARALFHAENPLGRSLVLMSSKESGSYEIVGVVGDTHYYDIHADPRPGVWFAIQQLTPYMPTLHVRTAASDTVAIVAAVRNEFNVVDKGFPVFNIRTLEMRFDDSLARERMVAELSAAFGVLALLLAAVGLYGVIAYSVSRRTREIGIRMALGSSSGSVLWLISREALLLVAAGSAAGIGISLVSTRLLKSYLFGVTSAGTATVFASTAAMLLIAAVAVSIPAARACRVDPLIALRHE
jgi:predicted permease